MPTYKITNPRPDLQRQLEAAARRFAEMSPAEQEAMCEAAREGYVRAEISWPDPKCRLIDGVLVYDSYEDYCA